MKNTTKIIQPLSKKIEEQLKIVAKDKNRIYKELLKKEDIEPNTLIKPISASKTDDFITFCKDISFCL